VIKYLCGHNQSIKRLKDIQNSIKTKNKKINKTFDLNYKYEKEIENKKDINHIMTYF